MRAHQCPAAMQFFAFEMELQLAGFVCGRWVALRFPVTDIPYVDMPGTILMFRNVTLEVDIVERVVFHMDCKPFVGWIEAWSLGDRPAFQRATEFKPEVIVQLARMMLLHHEAQPLGGRRDF